MNNAIIPALPGGEPALSSDFDRAMTATLVEVHGNLTIAPADVLRGYLLGLASVAKSLEKDRKDTLAPYKAATDVIQGFYKTHQTRLDGAVAAVKGRLLEMVKEAEAAARLREAEEQRQATEDRPTPPLLPRAAAEARPAVSTYLVTRVEITDEAAIPREFLVPDLKKIETHLKTGVTPAWARLTTETRIAAR